MEIEEQKWELTGEEEETSLVLENGKKGESNKEVNSEKIWATNGAQHHDKIIQELHENGAQEGAGEPGKELHKWENLVYYDNVEGIWKCQICTWTYQNENMCVAHIQHHQGPSHKMMNNFKTHDFHSQGFEFANGFSGGKQIVKDTECNKFNISSLDLIVQNNSAFGLKNAYNGDLENGTFSSSQFQSFHHKSYKEIESEEFDHIDGGDLQVTESDVERTIQNQTTHDLYCPNCKSCITKRVIVRKRKRSIRISDEDVRKQKEFALEKVLGIGSVQSHIDEVHQLEEVDDNDMQLSQEALDESDKEPALFRCLSCFSFFIPPGSGFKLFGHFGDKNNVNNVLDDQPQSMNRNWYAKMFGSNKQEPAAEQVTTENNSNVEGREDILHVASQRPSSEKLIIAPRDELDMKAIEAGDPMIKFGKTVNVNGDGNLTATKSSQGTVAESVNGATLFSQNGGLMLQISPNEELQAFQIKEEGQTLQVCQHIISETDVKIPLAMPLMADSISHAPGKDTLIVITEHPAGSSDAVEDTTPADTATATQEVSEVDDAGRDKTEERKEFEIEVVKSIVYGGLAECITSLSIISSASGGGAATLNILVLGMANLIGGLFVICHNLWELRQECVEQFTNEEVDQRDRYKELLGSRQHFLLHAIVAIVSYLVFGLVLPIVYGFSFWATDNKQLKLVVVAAASLVCIVMLAVGKAYVQRPPKPYPKMVISFVVLGLMVSGVSYAAGELVKRLMEKFQSGSRMARGSWASY